MKSITIKHFEEEGLELVSVPVVDHEEQAILLEQDFDDLILRSVSPVWRLKNNIITTRCNQRGVGVARLILDVRPPEVVQTDDGNPFNLKRSNLIVATGISKHRAIDLIKKDHRRRRVALNHIFQ